MACYCNGFAPVSPASQGSRMTWFERFATAILVSLAATAASAERSLAGQAGG
jgi:hypothetical protein